MWYVSVRERRIIIPNGRLNEVEVNTMLRYQLLWVTEKLNHPKVVKKEAWKKSLAASHEMNIENSSIWHMIETKLN